MSETQVDNAAATTATPADNAEATTANDEKDIVNDEELLNSLEKDFDEYKAQPLGLPVEEEEETEGDEPKVEKSEPKAEDPKVIETRATQKRFNDITQELRELRAENTQLKTKAPIDTSGLVAPNPDDYTDGADDPGFIAANGAYLGSVATLKLINENHQADSQRQATLDFQNRASAYSRKVVEVKKDIKDFDTIMAGSMLDAVDVHGNITAATDILLELENGPRVAAHIAKNPELALLLNRSTPAQVSTTICKISAQLSATPLKINKAPPPIGSEDKGGGPGAAGDKLRNLKGAKFY